MKLKRFVGVALGLVLPFVGCVIGLAGVYEVLYTGSSNDLSALAGGALAVLMLASAVALSHRSPHVALALLWGSLASQIVFAIGFLWIQTTAMIVMYFVARKGTRSTLWAGLVSAAAGPLLSGLLVMPNGRHPLFLVAGTFVHPSAVAAAAAALLLGFAWLLGFAARKQREAGASSVARRAAEEERSLAEQERERAEDEREQAKEIARLMEARSALARDVHDVVGHSLAVILAQAESVAYLPESDQDGVRDAVANIATAARNSLREVREVLGSVDEERASAERLDLWALIDSVRSSGREVVVEDCGIPAELDATETMVRYRVTQELLTNALRHGSANTSISLRHTWDENLTIEVSNAVDAVQNWNSEGRGLEGMRQRLTRVRGRLEISRTDSGRGCVFKARCIIPIQEEESA